MARGLNQFEVGTVADPVEVTGVGPSPPANPRGNDAKIQTMLSDLKLRNRAQPLSYNTVTTVLKDIKSATSAATNTQYIVYRTPADAVLHSAEIHVYECFATSAFPAVTVDAYLQSGVTGVGSANTTWDPDVDAVTVSIIPPVEIQAISANQSKGNKFPTGMIVLPVINEFIEGGRGLTVRFQPPAYNGSSAEGWRLATITLHFAEFHTS